MTKRNLDNAAAPPVKVAPLGGPGVLGSGALIVSYDREGTQLNGGNAALPPGLPPAAGMAVLEPDQTITINDPEGLLMRIVPGLIIPGVGPVTYLTLFCNVVGHNLPQQFVNAANVTAIASVWWIRAFTYVVYLGFDLNPKT